MYNESLSLADQIHDFCVRVCEFSFGTLPYVLLALLGHTSSSLDAHSGDWHWGTYLLSCFSSIALGVVLYCLIRSFNIPQYLGYAIAVLIGRNTKESLDMFSRDIWSWFYKFK